MLNRILVMGSETDKNEKNDNQLHCSAQREVYRSEQVFF